MNQELIDKKSRITSTITTLLDMHKGELVPALGKRLFKGDEDAARKMISAHRDLLIHSHDAIVTAHAEMLEEAADDEPYRIARDEESAKLMGVTTDTRNLIDAAYGDMAMAHFKLTETPPPSGEQLYTYVADALHIMREHPLTEPSPHGFDLDFEPIASKLEQHLSPLAQVLEDIRREAREIRESIDTLHAAISEFDSTYTAISEAIHAFCLIAKRPDIAAMLQTE
jgi:hypothetical protein